MLANELGRRNIRCLLVDPKPSTAFNPQANATQARTMEHFRRLGFANEIRAQGLPPHHPTDIAYLTRFSGIELARLRLPTAAAAALVFYCHGLFDISTQNQGQFTRDHVGRTACCIGHDEFDGFGGPIC